MENSFSDTGFIQAGDDSPAVLIEKALIYMVESFLFFTSQTIYISLLPAIWIYSFWAHAFEQSWQITKHVLSEIYELMLIVPLYFEACFWFWKSAAEFALMIKRSKEISEALHIKVYPLIKKILQKLHVLPIQHERAAVLYMILKKLPIISNDLWFPRFLFEDTFKTIDIQRNTISMTIPSTEDSSVSQTGAETQTTTATTSTAPVQTPASESLPAENQPKPATSKN
ncbi:uncharacterized protein LOC135844569 [Planococcus citri]|uniref:uncharacterized protein LOC135844569 n=1 Tax=Planococcus citri TaxID=170843 RepID=UPI0031FA0DA5